MRQGGSGGPTQVVRNDASVVRGIQIHRQLGTAADGGRLGRGGVGGEELRRRRVFVPAKATPNASMAGLAARARPAGAHYAGSLGGLLAREGGKE
jgi:hypothetical protein